MGTHTGVGVDRGDTETLRTLEGVRGEVPEISSVALDRFPVDEELKDSMGGVEVSPRSIRV